MIDQSSGGIAVTSMRIALIGYGEVGRIFGKAFRACGVPVVTAYDILLEVPERSAGMRRIAAEDGIELAESAAHAARDADLILSAVTASATGAATASVAPALQRGAFLLDVNSASPSVKTECAAVVARHGGRYVEAAVMTSVPPHGIRVPMLLGGPDAGAAVSTLTALGCVVQVASSALGVTSATKMCRSIIIKGLEALAIESFLTARRYGVENEVLASLVETFPGMNWEKNADYFWQRVVQHGRRRAEEMREAAVTVREAGVEPFMASAIADRQAWVAELARLGTFAEVDPKAAWRDLADCIKPEDGPKS